MYYYNDNYYNNDYLQHYGVLGMKWGHRKAQRASEKMHRKSKIASDSAKEWDEMARYAKSKGNAKKAAKYAENAKKDRADAASLSKKASQQSYTYKSRYAKKLEKKAATAKENGYDNASELSKQAKKAAEFDKKMSDSAKKTSTGKALAKKVVFGMWGDKTYEAAKAAGYGKGGAAAVTVASTIVGGPLGNMAATSLLRREYSKQ